MRKLTQLILKDNSIGDEGVRALAETEAMPGVDGDSVGGVLALLESQGLCARVCSAEETVLPAHHCSTTRYLVRARVATDRWSR